MKNKGKFFNVAVAIVIAITGMLVISACGSTQDFIDAHNAFVNGWNSVQ